MKTKTMTTLCLKKSSGRSPLRFGFLLIPLGLACFALSPVAEAVTPAPDGGYPGFNTAEGLNALAPATPGVWNTAIGGYALASSAPGGIGNTAVGLNSLRHNTTGTFNSALGVNSLLFNSTGSQNVGIGYQALDFNTTATRNTGVGFQALFTNNANDTTAVGWRALFRNTTGIQNTATGSQALFSNTTDSFNTATGYQALFHNTGDGGHNNVANGYQALFSNTTGRRNTADGSSALYSNTTGIANTAQGDQALYSNTAGSFHTAIGWGALASHSSTEADSGANTAVGESALVNHTTGGGNTAVGESVLVSHITGHQNIALGYVAGQNLTDGSGNIHISNPGVPTESSTIRIGNVVPFTDIYGFPHAAHTATYIAGISGQTASGGVAVYINSDGKLGTLTSSARFKTEIKPMDKASEAILALKPVTFRYKHEIDSKGTPQFGLVAEDVQKVNPDLVARDAKGEVYTVRYEAVNAMLLNEFLKQHRKVVEQEKIIAQQRKDFQATINKLEATIAQQQKDAQSTAAQQQNEIKTLAADLKEQTALIQKVSDKVELNRPAPQTVVNNQ
jgi:trimeric autotransporter adhesin